MYRYRENLDLYRTLCDIQIPKDADMQSVVEILVDISKKKHEIQVSNNKLINENITCYEKNIDLIDDDAVKKLNDFLQAARGSNLNSIEDISIYLVICRLLLKHYTALNDYNKMVMYLYYVLYCSNIHSDFAKEYKEPESYELMDVIKENYDKLSETGKNRFFQTYFAWTYNTGDMRKAPERLLSVCSFFENRGYDFSDLPRDLFMAYLSAVIDTSWQICENYGNEYPDYSEEEISRMETVFEKLNGLHKSGKTGVIRSRAEAVMYELEFVLGHISADELIRRLRRMFKNRHEDNSAFGIPTRTYYIPSEMLDVIWKYTDYSKNTKIKMSEEILHSVFDIMRENVVEEKVVFNTTDAAQFIMTASKHLGFDRMKRYVLEMTIFADKALYIHTVMVKEISQVILKEILDSEPWYLTGVAGFDEEYIKYNPGEVMSLMEECALFHDIGKHFCIDIVSNSGRNLTDDEFGIIKHHPENFDIFFPKEKYEWFKCIRDSARLHHTWFNGKAGYPIAEHTNNQPFVSIISIADSIDAATDIIGRPYTTGKTLQMLLDEFDTFRDTRYSAFVIDICKHPKVVSKINSLINNERKKINYEIMTERKR